MSTVSNVGKVAIVGEGYSPAKVAVSLSNEIKTDENMDNVVTSSVAAGRLTIEEIMTNLDDIAEINKSFELNRKMADTRKMVQNMGYALGINLADQETIHKNLLKNNTSEDHIRYVCQDEKRLDEEIFSRPDGHVIKVKPFGGDTAFTAKKDFVETISGFYELQKKVNAQLDSINKDTKEVMDAGIDAISPPVANRLKENVATMRLSAEESGNESVKKRADKIELGYTFDIVKDTIRSIPKLVKNAMSDYSSERRVTNIGERYNRKRYDANTATTLAAYITDDNKDSIEAQYLTKDEYVEGYENFFVFFLIRWYSSQPWKDKDCYTKDMHNTTALVLRVLMANNLNEEFRDEVIKNIAEVWALFKEYM